MTTYTAIDGSTVTPKTRADLMKHPAFAGLNVDSEGNPCVFENSYTCQSCTSEQIDWTDDWSCGCDDDCPNCGKDHSPHDQQWLAGCNPHDDIGCLWDSLPEKGDKEGEAAYGAMLASKAYAAQEPDYIEGGPDSLFDVRRTYHRDGHITEEMLMKPREAQWLGDDLANATDDMDNITGSKVTHIVLDDAELEGLCNLIDSQTANT